MTDLKSKSLDPKIEKHFDVLNKKLNLLFEELKYYSEDQLNRKPGKDQWSVIQVMHHLILVEKSSLDYIQKKLSFDPKLKKAGFQSWFRSKLIWISLKSPFKFKAPTGVGAEYLPEQAGFWDTVKIWKGQRVLLKEYLETLPEERMRQEIYKHPMVGRLGMHGMFKFFNHHFDRHHKQIRKLIKYFPKQN